MKAIFYQFGFFFFLLSLLFPLSGCGKESHPLPSVQKSATDQIVIIQTNPSGGGAGGALASGISISSVSLPQPLFQSTAVTYTDPVSWQSFIYVIGGAYYDPNYPDPINMNTVYSNRVQSDGTLSPIWNVSSNPPLPAGLRGHSSVIYNNAIYVIGGIGSGGFQKAIYRATISMNTSIKPPTPVLSSWQWVADLPVGETGQASAVSGNMLYVIGGVESGLPLPNCSPNCVGSQSTVFSNKIYGYNLLNFSTSSVSTFTMPKKLYTPAAIGLPNQVWVLGGWDGDANSNSDSAFSYNVTNGILSQGYCFPCGLPYGGVSKAIGLFLADAPIPQMVLVGGVSGTLSTSETIRREVYSSPVPSGGVPAWVAAPSLPNPVEYFSAASAGTFIYILGGCASCIN